MRVPFVVLCPPEVCPAAIPRTIDGDHLVLNTDVAPTIADLAGIEPPSWVDGRSLRPLLEEAFPSWREAAVFQTLDWFDAEGIWSDTAEGRRLKYVELEDGPQLYDLTADPWELQNLAGDEAWAGVRASLAAELQARLEPPMVTFTEEPPAGTSERVLRFAWTSDEHASFSCALDAAPLAPCGSGLAGSATYEVADGAHTFVLRATDAYNDVAELVRTVTVDTVPPTVALKNPVPDSLQKGQAVKVSWKASDNVGIARFDVYRGAGVGGALSFVTSTTAKTYSATGTPGDTLCFRVIAFDAVNATETATACTAIPRDDRALTWSGGVSGIASSVAFLGTLAVLDGPGEDVTATVTARKIGVLARKDTASGKVDVWIDGTWRKTVDLYSARTKNKNYAYTTTLPLGEHIVRLAWTGLRNASSSGTEVAIDGIAAIA